MVKYNYDAYGNEISNSNKSFYNPFRYKGYYYDEEIGLVMVGQRYYSPELCRFIQPADVSTLNPRSINGLNLYIFANNNPIGIAYSSFGATFGTGGGMIGSTRGTIGNIVGSGSVYVSSDIGFGSSWQLTPWLTGSSRWSLENGISISGGIIVGDTTHEITVSVGNGALLGYAVCAWVAALPAPGARAVAATAAFIIFIVDLFN